ncbi:MAG: ribbon-helix-helix protein, CopG family [Firmicutes bacterium]|nr:ribbon-helix-helix protein, CopG family [Bacillota bacterium]
MSSKRVQIYISAELLAEIDNFAQKEEVNRSQFIQKVMQVYIKERNSEGLQEQLKVGYQVMAELNLKLAEEGRDDELLEHYERQLAEAE